MPLHPRLAHMVLQAAELTEDLSSLAACLAALVSERDPLRKNTTGEISADIRLRLQLLRRPENKQLREVAEQIHRLSGLESSFTLPGPQAEEFCGMLLSLAWPERIAQRRGVGSFRLASGQGAELPAYDPLASAPWLATANLGGGVNRRVRLAAPVALPDLLRLHGEKVRFEEVVCWNSRSEAVVHRSMRRLGALILDEKPLPASPELDRRIRKALLEGIVSSGLDSLPWTKELRQLQARVIMLRGLERAENKRKNAWPDIRDDALIAGLIGTPESTWLSPW
ncbi:MAG: ATP-dependent helicase HrpB, partial [Deltaproteobacteria bacterium]|nr:ATP-dependent helicase HrpB [Deltaproteobacteria bacterium]